MAGHFFPNVLDIPASQRRECTRLLRPALWESGAVCLGLTTRFCSLPGVAQDVAALEVGAVSGLLERQILGEMVRVVAYM